MSVNDIKYKASKGQREICGNIILKIIIKKNSCGLIQGIKHGHNMLLICS